MNIRFAILLLFMQAMSAVQVTASDLAKDMMDAEAGDFDAMLTVGLAYLSDEDKANNADGVKWLEMSSAGGNVIAYYNLGAIHQDGGPVKQNSQKAVMYLTIAAELGKIRAMNRLAGIYYMGKLAPGNDILAIKWALCAASLGSETANENFNQMKEQIGKREVQLGKKAADAWAKRRLQTPEK